MKQLLILLLATTAHATTMTFSGVLTSVVIHDGDYPGYYSQVPTIPKVGDTFSGELDFNASFFTFTVRIGTVGFFADSRDNYGYFFSAKEFDVYPTLSPWGGTDSLIAISPDGFFASSSENLLFGDRPTMHVDGTVLKQSVFVPETSDTGELFGLGLLALAGMYCARRAK